MKKQNGKARAKASVKVGDLVQCRSFSTCRVVEVDPDGALTEGAVLVRDTFGKVRVVSVDEIETDHEEPHRITMDRFLDRYYTTMFCLN